MILHLGHRRFTDADTSCFILPENNRSSIVLTVVPALRGLRELNHITGN